MSLAALNLMPFHRPLSGALSARPSSVSACAVCGVQTSTAPTWAAPAGTLAATFWRRCDDCAELADELRSIRDPAGQAVALVRHILDRSVSPADRPAVVQLAETGHLVTYAGTGAQENDPGHSRRWEHLADLEARIVVVAEQLALDTWGVPHPREGRGCHYCGCMYSQGGLPWSLITVGTGRQTYACGLCRESLQVIGSAGDQAVTGEDRLAADWKNLPAVPRRTSATNDDYADYAESVGFVPFHQVPNAKPGRTRFEYLNAALSTGPCAASGGLTHADPCGHAATALRPAASRESEAVPAIRPGALAGPARRRHSAQAPGAGTGP